MTSTNNHTMQLKCWNGDDITLDKFPNPTLYKCPHCDMLGGLLSISDYYKALDFQENNFVLGMA